MPSERGRHNRNPDARLDDVRRFRSQLERLELLGTLGLSAAAPSARLHHLVVAHVRVGRHRPHRLDCENEQVCDRFRESTCPPRPKAREERIVREKKLG